MNVNVDEWLAHGVEAVFGLKRVSVDDFQAQASICFSDRVCAGHFPGMPVVPMHILEESAMQVGAILLLVTERLKPKTVVLPIDKKIHLWKPRKGAGRPIKPGEEIEIFIEYPQPQPCLRDGQRKMKGTIRRGGKIFATISIIGDCFPLKRRDVSEHRHNGGNGNGRKPNGNSH